MSATKFSRSAMSLIVSTQALVDWADAIDAKPRISKQLDAVEFDNTHFILNVVDDEERVEMMARFLCGCSGCEPLDLDQSQRKLVGLAVESAEKWTCLCSFGFHCGHVMWGATANSYSSSEGLKLFITLLGIQSYQSLPTEVNHSSTDLLATRCTFSIDEGIVLITVDFAKSCGMRRRMIFVTRVN